jgi:integrase
MSFQDEVTRWRAKVTSEDTFDDDAPDEALTEGTIDLRILQIRAFASALVHQGALRLSEIAGLSVFFEPDRFKAGLRWFAARPRNKESLRLYLLANALISIAKHHCKLDQAELDTLKRIAKKLKPRSPRQMSARNRELLRQFDDSRNVKKLLCFPREQVARAKKEKNPLRAAKRIERATAVSLMIFGGLRQATLRQMEMQGDFSWTRPNCEGICHLHVPGTKVKNERPVDRELPLRVSELLRLYLTEHRSRLPGAEGPYLFPGATGGIRARSQFAAGIKEAFWKDMGLKINPHLIRHAVAKIAVERDPGAYLAVSRVLGHAALDTTLTHYLGTEGKAAARHIDELLTAAMEAPDGPVNKPMQRVVKKPRKDS